MGGVRIEHSDRVAHLVLDRAPRRNALDRGLLAELDTALHEIEADGAVAAVVVRGDGPGFSAGIDATTLVELGTPAGLREIRGAFVATFELLERLPKPTVAQVHGWAIGAGFELALACDLRVVAADATLGLPETRMGVVPDVGGLSRLPALVGAGRAKELVLTSALFDGVRAGELGIANRVAAAAALDDATRELTDELLRCSPTANGLAKRIIDAAAKPRHDATLAAELDAQATCIATSEFAAAAAAFLVNPRDNGAKRP